MKPAQSNLTINQMYKRVSKTILQTIKNLPEINKQSLENALNNYQTDPVNALTSLRASDKAIKQIFDDHILEYNCWRQSFPTVVNFFGKQKEVQKIDIVQKLIAVQSKVKSKKPQGSYWTHIMIFVKKQLKFADEFTNKWKEQRTKIYQSKIMLLNQKIKPITNQNVSKQFQQNQQGINLDQPIEISTLGQLQSQKNKSVSDNQKQKIMQQKQSMTPKQRERRAIQRQKQIEKLRSENQIRLKKNKENRLIAMTKYLESRKQFSYGGNKEGVAKQILASLEKFIKQKMQKIIKYSKMRYPGYISEDAGDEFRMYSNRSNFIQVKHSAMLPETDLKFLKVKYPSKLELYLKLRIEQQRLQQKLKNELRPKIQSDKKLDKLLQNYLVSDQKQNFIQFERDDGPKKKQRLFVLPQVIQYVLEMEPWFSDRYIMERTFYRGIS